jgi:hypothetical protein
MDIKSFLNARSKELAPVGMMVIVSQGIPNGMLYSELQNGFMFECMSLSFIDMVKEVIKQMSNIQVLSFKIIYAHKILHLFDKYGQ